MSKKTTENNTGQTGSNADSGADKKRALQKGSANKTTRDARTESPARIPDVSGRNGGQKAKPRRSASVPIAIIAVLLALAAAAFSAWQMYEARRVAASFEIELASRLAEIETIGSESRRLSTSARDVARDMEARLGQIEARLVGIQNQGLAMDSLYKELALSRDDWTLAEVEQILLVASQQLELASNVKAALIALEAADARLARSDRPQLTEVRRVVGQDIERLKASPFVDVTGIGIRLESIMKLVDQMPLSVATRPVVSAESGSDPASEGWRRIVAEVWADLGSLIRVERVDDPVGPLLAPEQAFFVRENVKLRLLGARLALIGRDEDSFEADLTGAIDSLNRYFDSDSEQVASSVASLQQLAQSGIRVETPNVGASLDAIRAYRLVGERSSE